MRKVPVILFTLFVGILPASARLGWTLEQCEKQYGWPVETDLGLAPLFQGYEFHVGNYVVICELEKNGVCGAVTYRKKDKTGFLPVEAADLVHKNAPGVHWTAPVIDYGLCIQGDVTYNEYFANMYSIPDALHPEAYFVYMYAGKNKQDCLWMRIAVKQAANITPGL